MTHILCILCPTYGCRTLPHVPVLKVSPLKSLDRRSPYGAIPQNITVTSTKDREARFDVIMSCLFPISTIYFFVVFQLITDSTDEIREVHITIRYTDDLK